MKSKHGASWGGDQEEGCEGAGERQRRGGWIRTQFHHTYENTVTTHITLYANLKSRLFIRCRPKVGGEVKHIVNVFV